METMSWRESFSCLFLNCFLFNLASVETQMRTSVNTFYEESPKWPTTDGLTGFGGVLKKGVIDMLSNNTDVREIVTFAVRHARSSNPVMFPASAASKYMMHVRNISQLKLIYSLDGEHPAMFGAVDPVLQQAIYVPLVWGLMYTFSIHLIIAKWPAIEIIHRYTILEYHGSDMYVLEHSFHLRNIPKLENHHHMTSDQSEWLAHGKVKASKEIDQSVGEQNTLGLSNAGLESGQLTSSWDKLSQYKAAINAGWTCRLQEMHDSCHSKQDNEQSQIYASATFKPGIQSGQFDSLSQQMEATGQPVYESLCTLVGCINGEIGHSRKAQKRQNISILSYNIWNMNSVNGRNSAYIKRIKSLGKFCAKSQADVITFQEVRFQDDRGGHLGPNQLDHLSDLLPQYQFAYQPAQVQSDRLPGLAIEGIAIFSKYPIVHRNAVWLSRNPDDAADGHQRVLLHAEIDIPAVGLIHVLSTHLSLSHEARLLSVVEISDYISRLQGPVFLTGDMNAEAHNEEVRFLAGKHTLRGRRVTGFHDVWEYHHGNCNHGNSTEKKKQCIAEGLTFSALDKRLTKRIDLIFFKEHPRVTVLNVTLLDNGLRGEKAASDHLGIMAKFEIEDGR